MKKGESYIICKVAEFFPGNVIAHEDNWHVKDLAVIFDRIRDGLVL